MVEINRSKKNDALSLVLHHLQIHVVYQYLQYNHAIPLFYLEPVPIHMEALSKEDIGC